MSANPLSSTTAVEALYLDHHSWLKSWLRRKLGDAHQAADLAHDTFLRILRSRNAADIREPREYLATIAKGLMFDLFRRQSVERAYLEVLAAQPEAQQPSLETRAIVVETLTAIAAMLDGMKPAIREAFMLSQIEGLTYAEIARRLGVTTRTVNNYMLKAIEHCYLLAAE